MSLEEQQRLFEEEYAEEIGFIRQQYQENEERRGARVGKVVSVKNAKSITVLVPYKKYFPKYNMHLWRSSRIMAHDDQEIANRGDIVRIVPCRPMSAKKRHILKDIVKAKVMSKFDPVRTKRSTQSKPAATATETETTVKGGKKAKN